MPVFLSVFVSFVYICEYVLKNWYLYTCLPVGVHSCVVLVFASVFMCACIVISVCLEKLTRKLGLAHDIWQSSQVLELKGFTTTPSFIIGYKVKKSCDQKCLARCQHSKEALPALRPNLLSGPSPS